MSARLLTVLLAAGCTLAWSSSATPGDEDDAGHEWSGEHARDFSREEASTDVPVIPPPPPMPPACGDGELDPGEECDDGNRMNGDACDWECRNGPGSFEYPPLDPTTPAIEPAGPSTTVTIEDELTLSSFSSRAGRACRGIWLQAGGGRFALAYDYDRPSWGVRVRMLDRSGAAAGPAWSRETPWSAPQAPLAWNGDEFALFTSMAPNGVFRSRFAPDATVLDEMVALRGPDPCTIDRSVSCWRPMGAAWNGGRWALAGPYSVPDRPWGAETYDGTGIRLASRSLLPDGAPPSMEDPTRVSDCLEVGATPAGFVLSDGISAVVVDLDLNPIGWSGTLRDFSVTPGALDVAPDGIWVAWLDWAVEGSTPTNQRYLWTAAFDLNGNPRFPPRIVHGPFWRAYAPDILEDGTPFNELAIAHGPAGAAIVFWEGQDEWTPGGSVKILNLDDWANVRTPPQSVLEDEATTPVGWVLGIDADDDGYGVVTAVEGSVPGTAGLVFRYFVPVP